MSRVFHANTLYQLLLMTSLNEDIDNGNKSHLVIEPGFEQSDRIIALFRERSNFASIIKLNRIRKEGGVLNRMNRSRNSLQSLRIARAISPDSIYVSNDNSTAAQSLLTCCGESATVTYVEDGVAAYSSSKFDDKNNIKLLVSKLFYGYWWSHNKVLGTSSNINRVAATFPEQVRPALQNLPAEKIENNLEPSNGLIQGLIQLYDMEEVKDLDVLVLPVHSTISSDNHENRVRAAIDEYIESGSSVGIKYHPRDANNDYLGLSVKSSVVKIPPEIPAEMLYLSQDLERVMGGASTALMSAKWLLNDVDVVLLTQGSDHDDGRLTSVMGDIGIRMG